MAGIHFEIFDNTDFGNKNIRFSEAPAQEQREFLKQNGYSFTSRYGGAWYPRTQEAKSRNSEFVKEFAERFYPENNRSLPKTEENDFLNNDDKIAYLESLIAELKAERERDQEKISRLEAALENKNEENSAEIEMQKEQLEIDGEAEWERENTLTDEEEKAYIERHPENKVSTETIEITDKIMDFLYDAAEKEAAADTPQAEKKILRNPEMPNDDALSVSPEELAAVKSVLPAVQYVSALKFAQGEEREFFVKKIKEIAAAVEKAPGIGGTDGLEEHKIVLRYFHPSGTQSFVTEIGKDGEAFGFQCLNGDWENAEWGYLNLDELKNIRGMEADFHVPAGMTVEKFIQKEKTEQNLSGYENSVEAENGQTMAYADAREWNEEQRMQYSQEEDGRGAEAAARDFDTVRKLEGIVSEIKDAGFTLESKYENEKHAVTLRNKSGEVIFSARENDNIVIPVERTIAAWANDGASEKAKTLADEFFSLVCEDGIRGGDYVNNVFTSSEEISENDDYIHSEESVPPVSASEIEEEKLSIQKTIQQLKDELNNPDVNNPADDQYISETKEYIERLENMTDEDFKNIAAEKKEQQKKNEEAHRRVVEHMAAEKQSREIPQEGELLSYNETHPTYSVVNKETNRQTSIQPRGRLEENVRRLGRLSTLAEARNAVERIKSSGFEILSTESRVVIFNEDKFYDFDSVPSYFNYTTNKFEHNSDARALNDWDFKDYIKGGLKITKRMKAFEKIESKTAGQETENKMNEAEIANNEENPQAIYFNDLSPEQKEEVINGYRSADDQDMLTEWENVLRKNLTQIKKDNPFIPSLDIEKEISVAANPPSDEWISEYLQKNKVNFNTDFWQDIFAEMEAKPDLKTYHTLKESDVKDLEIVSDEEFFDIVDSIILNDYKNIPNAIRLPNLNAELSEKLGLEKDSAFILKKSAAHIRPDRKGSYEQALDTEEYREIPQVMRDATFALVDNRVKNFQILFDDKNDIKKINKIVFNKDELGNYLVTVGKVGRQNGISEKENIVVGVGVAPTISDLRFPKGQPATRLRPSPTTDELNIAQEAEKSSVPIEKQKEPLSKKKLSEIRSQCREILRKSDSEITDDDKAVLAKYEGAGGLNEDNRSVNGVLNEFYTPQNLVEKVWELVDAYAPDAKTVLEPSAGIGKFADRRPKNEFTMHELDETSARINRILHPAAEVVQGAYQRQFFDEGGRGRKSDFVQPKYDVVIGNPPYGKYSDKYKGLGEGKEFDRYEEYFISKGLDALKDEKSLLAFVVPSGFLNSENDKTKNLIASQGELIDAYRLPAGTFPTTEVGTDIIVMKSWDERKRALNERARGNEAYQKLEITSWTKREVYKISGGQWFKDHPEKILGKTVGFTDRFGKPAIKVVPHDGLSVQDELDKIDGFLPQEGIENPGENHSRKTAEPRTEILSSDFKGFRNIADRISAIDESAQNRIGAVKIKTDAQAAEEYFSFMKSHIDFDGSLSTSVFNELENRNRHTATAALSIMGFFGKENQEYFAQRSEKNRDNPDSYDFPPETVAKEINLSRGQKTPGKLKNENAGQLESNPQTLAANFVLEKLKAAGIEVVTDKEEFDRILEREKFLQKMAGTLTPEEQKRYFTFNEADTARFKSQVDEWKKSKDENNRFNPGKLIKVGEIPPLFNALGITDNPIEVQYSTLSKMVRPLPQGYPNDAQGHALSADDIYDIPSQLADPIMVFKSRTRDDSYVFFTERKDSQNHSILIPLAVNKRKGRIVINEITSMYGKDNEIDFVRKNIDEGNLIYADKKRSLEWERECKVQFLTQGLPSQDSGNNILTKERLVNFISAGSQKRTPVQKMALASDRENVYGFAYEGKIYLNPDFLSSNVAVHEYTHLWDEYTRRTNPELWQKGMNIFKDTKFFNEVKGDPDYADIANDDNLVLSEVHARICGDMAEKTLERIANEDGEITKDKAIDWNEETAAYILDFLKKATPENEFIQEMEASEIRKDMIEFFAMPMKDLMNGKNISVQIENQKGTLETENHEQQKSQSKQNQTHKAAKKTQKSKWSITKSKGEVMSAEEFAHLYGRDFDEREFPIWRATDWQGNIDLSKLSADGLKYLSESGKYVQKNIGEWTHKELFASGDIYAKIEEQKALFEKSGRNALFTENISLLESVKKPTLPMEHIHFGVKTTLAEEFTVPHIDADGNKADLNLQESFILWAQNRTLESQDGRRWIDFATANISREELPENVDWSDIVNYIDGTPVKAEAVRGWRTYDMSDAEKKAEKAERRREADIKRQARSDAADRLFDRYLHEGLDGVSRARLQEEYNRRFNSYIVPDYSKLPLFVDGMSAYKGESKFKLYDQQIKGISFLCSKGNGLLAYDVGVGKTAAGIVATVNQIQTGRSKRPLIVVPNTVYPKWYENIQALFPNMKVNDLYNLNKESSSKYRDAEAPHKLDIPENSISLVTYEALKNITFTDTSCENELFEDYSKLLSEDFEGSARENAQNADKIKSVIGAASQIKNSDYVFFEDCGFDNILVDEAHNFKNLWTVPRPKSKGESNEFSGIPTSKPSVRALKLFAMAQLTQRHNEDRNVFLLTATPFVNSPLEVYSMISYVGRKRLVDSGIYSLRDFCTEFAHTKLELGVNAKGEIDQKQVMKSWKELPALQSILTEFIDKVDGEEAGIIRPNKFTHVKPLDMSDLQKQMREIDEERMAEVKEGNSAAVIVAMNNMRLSCVAPALANPAMYPGVELPPLSDLVETSPKLKFVCDAIIDMYKGNPEKGQFMYVPLGKESHGIIKDYLVSHGIPKDAVEIINGEINSTPEKKEKVTSKFNDERNPCKIIIGGRNTAEGIDLNGNSFVMYNCSLGWNPSETIQAEGRIWRQGNLQGNVHIVYPVMNDSIDSVLYQKHDEKRSRINELWNYKGDSLNVEDINPEDLKLDLIKDPQKKAKLILQEETKEARAELSRISLKIKSFDEIIEKRSQLELDFSDAKNAADSCNDNIKEFKDSGLEAPEWMKSELRNCGKKVAKAESALEKVREKLSSLKITDSGKEAEYIHDLNVQKHACEEKISHIEKTLPQVLKKLEIERMEQKLIEYPVEKQRGILEADILNNLRPMKEVEYEVKTMRHEAMLSEKLEAGKITEDEFNLYKNAGYEKYEKWLNGEIDSLGEDGAENKTGIEKESFIKTESADESSFEKIIVYFDGHWPEDRGEKGKGWKYSEKSFTSPQEALDFYRSAKIPKGVRAENENGDRLALTNPEKQLSEMVSQHNKMEASEARTFQEPPKEDQPEENRNDVSEKQRNQEMDALYADSGSLFFGLDDSDILSVHSHENGYRKTAPYDDFSITERQLTESEMRRDEIIFPVLNGEKSGMCKAFNDFAEHGVFDIQGKNIELGGSGKISETGWSQLQAAMEIYRSKQFETFRYVLVDRESGEIRDQLAVKSYFPNCCAVSSPDFQTIKQVITRAEEIDCMVAAVHNHPSGNTVESSFDVEATEAIKKFCTRENGFSRFAGHIILDHDTFNLYTPEKGWNRQLNSNAYGNSEDKLLNKNFAFLKDSVDSTYQLENVAKKINDRNSWNDSFIPVVFADSQNKVSGVKLYDKSFFDSEPQKIRNELQFSGLEAGAVKAFPVITRNFAETMSAVDEQLFEDKLKNLVERSAFMDAALPESTVTEKFNILPGRQYFDVYGAKMKNPDIEATWQTRINPSLFSEAEKKTMRKKEAAFER